MASFTERNGKTIASIKVRDPTGVLHRLKRSFGSLVDAKLWAYPIEIGLQSGKTQTTEMAKRTVRDLLTKYRDEVSPKKDGHRWEEVRLNLLMNEEQDIADLPLSDIDKLTTAMAQWRDRRLRQVAPASVIREMTLLSSAFHTARREWKWITKSPLTDVQRPEKPDSRDRLISVEERDAIIHVAGYFDGQTPETATARTCAAFLFACETAMRCGEICALSWDDINLDKGVAKVRGIQKGAGKTRAARRDVALTSRSKFILRQMLPLRDKSKSVFHLHGKQIDAHWRKITEKAGIDDLHFHDSRHSAITFLASKMQVLDLARMVGIQDLRVLLVYYNKSAEDIAHALA